MKTNPVGPILTKEQLAEVMEISRKVSAVADVIRPRGMESLPFGARRRSRFQKSVFDRGAVENYIR